MILQVSVKPGSKKGPCLEKDGEDFVAFLRERPIEGAANTALIKLLSEYFSVPKTSIIIKKGHHGRKKIVEIPEV